MREVTYEMAGVQVIRDKMGQKGLRHDNQILLEPGHYLYIEDKLCRAIRIRENKGNREIVHGYEVIYRTISGYLGIAFFDTKSMDEGWCVYTWTVPFYASSVIRLPNGQYHFKGHEGIFTGSGDRM